MSNELKCNCRHCNRHIAFPAEMAGQSINCPHCQLETLLFIPPVAAPPKLKSKTTAVLVIIGCLFVATVIGVAVIRMTKSSNPSAKPGQKSDEHLQAVTGAFGWNLGDLLPNNFEVKTNDDAYGIVHFFNVPLDKEQSEILSGDLILTEDRRIAGIYVSNMESEHFNRTEIAKMLKEKYGFRERNPLVDYFGPTNRQAILRSSGSLVDLEYRDEELLRIAESQAEARKATANKQVQNDLKGHL